MNCQYYELLVCATARETFVNSCPSPVKFCFARTRPRQRTNGCSVIHPPSGHQTFDPEVELRQCFFCKETLSFWFASRLRNFGLLESEFKYCASLILILIPLSQDVPNLSPEKCVRVPAILCRLDHL